MVGREGVKRQRMCARCSESFSTRYLGIQTAACVALSPCRSVRILLSFSLCECVCMHVCVCVGVFHCQSQLFIRTTMMPRPPDAKMPVGIGFKTSPFQKKKKTKQSYFLATLVALLFCIFLIISPCRIIVRHIKANLYLHKYFPGISLSFFRFEHSFSLEILRRVNLESFYVF